jgi:hypothetical protein
MFHITHLTSRVEFIDASNMKQLAVVELQGVFACPTHGESVVLPDQTEYLVTGVEHVLTHKTQCIKVYLSRRLL